MPRKRSTAKTSEASSEASSEANSPANSATLIERWPAVPLVVFGLLVVLTLSRYYVYWGQNEPPDAPQAARRTAIVFLSAPDRLAEMWCGGKFEYFSLLDRWLLALL